MLYLSRISYVRNGFKKTGDQLGWAGRRTRFLKSCLDYHAIDERDLDRVDLYLKAAQTVEEAQVLYDSLLRLGSEAEQKKNPDLAVRAYDLAIANELIEPKSRREVMLKIEAIALSTTPPNQKMLVDLVRFAEMGSSDQDLVVRFQQSIVNSLSSSGDVKARSESRGTLAVAYARNSMKREARLMAKSASEPVDRVRGYLKVVSPNADHSYIPIICESQRSDNLARTLDASHR